MARQVFNIAALLSLMLAVVWVRVVWQYGDASHTLFVIQHKDSVDTLSLTPDGFELSRQILQGPRGQSWFSGGYSSWFTVTESYSGATVLYLVLPSIWLIREFKIHTWFTETEDGVPPTLPPNHRRWANASLTVGVLGPAFFLVALDVLAWLEFIGRVPEAVVGFLLFSIPVAAVVFAYQSQPKWQGDKIGEVGKILIRWWVRFLFVLILYDALMFPNW